MGATILLFSPNYIRTARSRSAAAWVRPETSGVLSKHRRVVSFEHFPVAEVHVDAARQAGVETPDRTHDVYALEFVRAIFFKDRRVLHRVLVRPGRSVNVARVRVPRGRRIGMIIG